MTLNDIKTKIKRDLDLEEETFITEDELTDTINEAIKMCEAQIHGLYEDYFKTEANLALIAGTANYSLPSDIYADKIRKIIYDDTSNNGANSYEIYPIKNLKEIPIIEDTDDYRYLINNAAATGTIASSKIIKLYPASRETSSDNVTIHYIRKARQLSASTDTCDIPEFIHFIIQYAKVECLKKEQNMQMVQIEDLKLQKMEKLMIDTLMTRKDDENNELLMDVSTYTEMGDC